MWPKPIILDDDDDKMIRQIRVGCECLYMSSWRARAENRLQHKIV